MAVVGLVLSGWPGHDNPARRFGRVLSEAGHEVLGWTPEELGAGKPGGREAAAAAAVGQHLAARLAGLAVELTGPAIERLDQHEVDLVVHDSMTPWGRLAADWLGLPRIGSLTHYPGPLLQPPAGGRSIAAGGQVGRSRRVLLEKWGIDVGEESELVFNAGDVTLLYTIPSVLGSAPPGQCRLVGPLLEPAPTPPPEDGGPPLVYVSMGTSFNRNLEAHRAVLEGLAGLDVRVLVSTGRGLGVGSLGPLPANATATEWADTRAVLATAALFVTHGGATSLHEALAAGVPVLVLPQAVDQPRWGERTEALGVGAMLTEPAPEDVAAAAARLLGDPEVRRRAEALRAELEGYDGAAIAVEAAESLIG